MGKPTQADTEKLLEKASHIYDNVQQYKNPFTALWQIINILVIVVYRLHLRTKDQ